MKKKEKGKIHINPPPRDRRCECCGIHISKLKPFGKAGDPLVGDFDGALLVKTFRAMADYQSEKIWKTKSMMVHGRKLTKAEEKEYKELQEKAIIEKGKGWSRSDTRVLNKEDKDRHMFLERKHYDSYPHLDEDKFIKKYGEEALKDFCFCQQLESTVEASWECRDCILLCGKEFYEKRSEGYYKPQ